VLLSQGLLSYWSSDTLTQFTSAIKLFQEAQKRPNKNNNPSKQAIDGIKWICSYCPAQNSCKGKLPKTPKNHTEFQFAFHHNDFFLFTALLREDTTQFRQMICKLRGWLYLKYLNQEYTVKLEEKIAMYVKELKTEYDKVIE